MFLSAGSSLKVTGIPSGGIELELGAQAMQIPLPAQGDPLVDCPNVTMAATGFATLQLCKNCIANKAKKAMTNTVFFFIKDDKSFSRLKFRLRSYLIFCTLATR